MPAFSPVKTTAILALAALLGACSPSPQEQETVSAPSVDDVITKNWLLVSLNGNKITALPADAKVPSLAFDSAEKRVSGSSGCNRFMGGYSLDNNALAFKQLASTMMMCGEQAMQLEKDYVTALSGVSQWSLLDGELVLMNEEGKSLVAFNAVMQTEEAAEPEEPNHSDESDEPNENE